MLPAEMPVVSRGQGTGPAGDVDGAALGTGHLLYAADDDRIASVRPQPLRGPPEVDRECHPALRILTDAEPSCRNMAVRAHERHRDGPAVHPDLDVVTEEDAGGLEVTANHVQRQVAEMVDRDDLAMDMIVIHRAGPRRQDNQARRIDPGARISRAIPRSEPSGDRRVDIAGA